MKKLILLTLLFVAGAATTFAQTVSFGVKAGLNISKWQISNQTQSLATDGITGFHAGGIVDIKFGSFSVQPGVLFTTKGSAENVTQPSGYMHLRERLNYIEIPVNLLYRVTAGKGNVFFGGGPYVAFGLSGKGTGDSNFNGQQAHVTQDYKFGSGDGELKSPEIGINALVGYQLNMGLMISAGYGWGLTNMAHSDGEGKLKNKGLEFSLGYFFK